MSRYIPNSFMVANAFVDETLNKISDASVKIYLIIVRKTRGWTKECDALSLTKLEEFSNKSRPTVIKCLNELVKVGIVKKHNQSKFGNVYSLIDHYDIGKLYSFPSKKNLLVREFIPMENDPVKKFNYPKIEQKITKIRLNFASKENLLVKNFNYILGSNQMNQLKFLTSSSKNYLPQLVKIFNTQNKTIKTNYQNKYNWLDFENLEKQIISANTSVNPDEIFNSSWFSRELEAFTEFNLENKHSNKMMIYFFADWLISANTKYCSNQKPKQKFKKSENKVSQYSLSFKQIYSFATKLSHHPEIAGKLGEKGESFQSLAARLAQKLSDPIEAKKLEPYLKQVGFKGELIGDAA